VITELQLINIIIIIKISLERIQFFACLQAYNISSCDVFNNYLINLFSFKQLCYY
jgi:hypothetical protein